MSQIAAPTGGRIDDMKEGAMDTTAELDAWVAEVERQVDAARRELAELEAGRLSPATRPASRPAGHEVGMEEVRERVPPHVHGDHRRWQSQP